MNSFALQLVEWRTTGQITAPMELLLLIGGANWESQLQLKVAQLLNDPKFDWEDLLCLAQTNGIRPLVWRYLQSHAQSFTPKFVQEKLLDETKAISLGNLGKTGELWTLTQLFAEAGIRLLPFKGPTLAVLAFDDVSLREFGDLDLLLEAKDVEPAMRLMAERGYQLEFDLPPTAAKKLVKFTYVLEYFHPVRKQMVELHWQFTPAILPFSLAHTDLQGTTQAITVAGKSFETFALEELLFYLTFHGAKHWWQGLNGLVDVAALINRYGQEMNWQRLFALAREHHCESVLNLGLLLVRELLNTSLPTEVVDIVCVDRVANDLAVQVCKWHFIKDASVAQAGLLGNQELRIIIERDLFYMRLYSKWSLQLQCMWHFIFSPTMEDWHFWSLPPKLNFLYPLVRIIRLIKQLFFSR